MWGRVREGAKAPVPLSAEFQSLPSLPTIKLGLSGDDSRVGGLVHALGPCGSLQRTLPVRLGAFPGAASTLMGVFNQRFGALVPCTGAPGCVLCFAPPAVPPGLSMCKCGATGSSSHHLVGSASCSLACPTPQSATSLGPPAAALPPVPSTPAACLSPPTVLDECFFFISLVVRLPYSSIFCQFWLSLIHI